MAFSKLFVFFLAFFVFAAFQESASAAKRSYIVYLGSHAHATDVSEAELDRVTDSHIEFLGSFLGSHEKAKYSIFYSYKRHINGFAANLEEEEAAEINKHPNVVSVFLNQARKLHTTHSWEFMSMDQGGVVHSSSLWKKARFGEDTIIGNLDTGVWPTLQSFSDKGYGPIPSKWKGNCKDSHGVHCNRKLIGAKYYVKGFVANHGPVNSSFETAVDVDGHGSHTLSTAGGNFVPNASIFGVGKGTAKGGSPRARVASYKVCWPGTDTTGGCFDADIMAAFDRAIHDGVDVLSLSLGGDPSPYFQDGISIGSFHAVKKGIVVVCSAGNDGPTPGTVSNVSPWIITVGASTLDREFRAFVELRNGLQFKGKSLSTPLPEDRFLPLITGAQARAGNASAADALLCLRDGVLDPKKVKGKILVCLRGINARVDKGRIAALAGAAGMILCNDEADGNEIIADPHVLPASHINYKDGHDLFAYINSTRHPVGFITDPTAAVNIKPAPFMAAFSSQGPNIITPEILKPDITAPGVDIIAGFTHATSATGLSYDHRKISFNIMSGTSMSCPHVSGVVGLLKTLHPTWSPAAIRSAIMTSSRTRDNTVNSMLNASYVKATPFEHGAGHIRPNRAMNPGLVYDLTTNDYLNFLCSLGYKQTNIELFSDVPYKCPKNVSLWDFNYPSIAVPNLSRKVTVTRKLKNVGSPGIYAARVLNPVGVSVHVKPNKLKFKKVGEEKSFTLTLEDKEPGVARDYVFGGLIWSDGKHYVRSPIVVSTVHRS